MKHKLEIHINAEGDELAYLCPIKPDGSIDGGYRIAGPKAWGGSRKVAEIDIPEDDLITYVREYINCEPQEKDDELL